MNIYIGNFSYDITEEELQEEFSAFGNVESVKIIKDQSTGNSRGFGFIKMPDKKEALAAIEKMKEIKGKKITINEARPPVKRSSFGRNGGNSWGNNFKRSAKRY